jgi:hypothetical protein
MKSLFPPTSSSEYELSILLAHSTPRLRRAVLDNPPQPDIPWHEYPVPTHMKVVSSDPWEFYRPGQLYVALKYTDGSIWTARDGVLHADGDGTAGGTTPLTHPPEL